MSLSGQGPTSNLNTIVLSDFTDLVEKEFKLQQNMVKPVAQQLFISDPIGANTGDTRRYEEVDTQTYAKSMPEGTDAKKAQVGTGYYVVSQVVRRAMEIDITFQMRRYNKYPEVTNNIRSLSWFCPQRRELDLTHRFTFGNASSYVNLDGETVDVTVGDGFPLFYAAHTLAFSPLTYTNIVAGAPVFSQGAYEAAELLTVTNILSNFGERRVMDFNVIWTSDDPNTCNEVKRLLQSTTDVDQNNPGVINVFKNSRRHVILPQLATTATGAYDSTKRRWWGIAAAGQGVNGWQAYFSSAEPVNMKSPAPGNNGDNVHNDVWTYGTRESYAIAALSGRGDFVPLDAVLGDVQGPVERLHAHLLDVVDVLEPDVVLQEHLQALARHRGVLLLPLEPVRGAERHFLGLRQHRG